MMGVDERVAGLLARGEVDEAAMNANESLGPAVLGHLASLLDVLGESGSPVEPATLRKRFERIKHRLAKLARDEGLLE